ncbi:alpha/beta hydrolase [Natribacillus halophilus]|uniref:Phospholipase/carboxylesterase n=1 Tax=Natribacillus halophilus TaxID=549003 RepID=A0A1G8QGI7_9BACI|nr:alpha/beta hydrolase [Natribacillus halophilus]SDJ03716.1 phospholipase/carboxylesterase [Natribacillus halophilus]
MKHIFQEGTNKEAPVLLLLHGTGGDENDLLPLAEMIAPESSVLSVRGNVSEGGMPRFFRRLAEGVFDKEDLIYRTKELADFLDKSADDYGFDRQNIVAVGYSNGANIAASLLYNYENVLKGALLHHPMVPLRDVSLPSQKELPVFIGAGKQDPICRPEETEELASTLEAAGANVELFWEDTGHQLTKTEVEAASEWFRNNF